MAWTPEQQPFGVNHAPLLTGTASDGSGVGVPVAVDPDTGAVLTSGGGSGGGGTQYSSGTTTPNPVVGNALIFDDAGTLQDVSTTNPLPVAATFSGTVTSSPTFSQNPAAGTPTPAFGLIDASFRPQVSVATALPAGTNAIGSITNTSFAATQSGTWNLNNISGTISLPTGAATSSNQTNGSQKSQIVDSTGANTLGVNASGQIGVSNFPATQPVSGTIAATQSGTWDVGLSTGSNTIGAISNTSFAATQATAANLNATVVGTVTANAGTGTFNIQSNASVNLAQLAGNTVSSGVGTSGTGTLRTVVANDTGRSLQSASGSASSSGNNTLVNAGTNRLKVFAFTLSTTSTSSTTCIFQSGASGTELWRVVLQAPTSVSTGANLVVQPPAWLFATATATLLNLNLSGANAVHWSVSYWDET